MQRVQGEEEAHRALKFGKSEIQERCFITVIIIPKWLISECFSLKIYIFYEPANRILSNNEIDFRFWSQPFMLTFFILLEHYEKRERGALILDFFFEKSPFEGLD